METWFILNMISAFIAFKGLQHFFGIQYAKPLAVLLVVGILHTVTMMRMMNAHDRFSQRLLRSRLSLPQHDAVDWLQFCAFCLAVFAINWVTDTFLLTELPLFQIPGLAYSVREPLILGAVTLIISLVGIHVYEGVMASGNLQYTLLPVFWNLGIMLVSFEVLGRVFDIHYARPYLLFPLLGILHILTYFALSKPQQAILPFLLTMLAIHFVIDTLILTVLPYFHHAGVAYSICGPLVVGGITVVSIIVYCAWFFYKLGTGFTML